MLTASQRQSKRLRPEIVEVSLDDIQPATINDVVYGATDPQDPSLDELAHRMTQEGQLEPVVLTQDGVLLSGHRRRAVAIRLGWRTLKARYHPIRSTDPDFAALLVAWNDQRDKSPDVRIREQLVLADPDNCYQELMNEREAAARIDVETLTLGAGRRRSRISPAKQPFLDAISRVLEELREYWPLSDRRIHYALLNDPPLVHASKPDSLYRNDHSCYKATCELLTRARLGGLIPFDAIGDETRPVTTWAVFPNVGPYFRRQVDKFCTGYARDLLQSQESHIEIVGEKLTIEGTIRPVAMKFCIPCVIGRGYCSLPPRKAMFDRFRKSGKSQLVLLFLSDLDPEGMNIPESFSKSMRDDFGVSDVRAIKVALKPEQVQQLGLPPNTDAKKSSSRYKEFAARFGPAAYELEAVPPATLQGWLDEAIRSVLDIERFNAEVDLEKQDAAKVSTYKRAAIEYLKDLQPE